MLNKDQVDGAIGAHQPAHFQSQLTAGTDGPLQIRTVICLNRQRRTHCGRRQQWGLHGPASGGGQPWAIGSAVPDATRLADTLISFSIFREPHFGQAGTSFAATSNSHSVSQSGQEYSKIGIVMGPSGAAGQ